MEQSTNHVEDEIEEIDLQPTYETNRQPIGPVNLQEDEIRAINDDPPTYEEVLRSNRVSPNVENLSKRRHWTKTFKKFWTARPILLLFTIILLNGFISMAIAAIFIELEGPAQRIRLQNKLDLYKTLNEVESNLTKSVRNKSRESKKLFEMYVTILEEYHALPDEIEWEMLSASAFVNSVSSTTGHGHILPVTLGGKLLTLFYALYGIPVFLWYIIKLGALCRVSVKRFLKKCYIYFKYLYLKHCKKPRQIKKYGIEQLMLNITKPVLQVVGEVVSFQPGSFSSKPEVW